MPDSAVSDWSTTASSNTTVNGASIAEGCAPSGINDAIRGVMAGVKAMLTQLQGFIGGLTLSNDVSSPNTVLDIAAGSAMSSDNAFLMNLASAYTKTTGSWAVGTGNGGLDTGSVANATWYHVYLIARTDTDVVDVLFSTSASAPTMPTNYTKKRRIGSILTDGSAHIIAFVQLGDEFLWKTSVADANAVSISDAVAHLITISVPTGVQVNALFHGIISPTASNNGILFSSPDETDQACAGALASLAAIGTQSAAADFNIRTSTVGQIRYRYSSSATSLTYVATRGWIDTRGRFA